MNKEIGLPARSALKADSRPSFWDRLNRAVVTGLKMLLVGILVVGIPAFIIGGLYGVVMLISMAWHAGAH